MTKNEYFFTLHEILVKAHEENAVETATMIIRELNKLPSDLQIFIVASKTAEIPCIDRKMAKELWNSNDNFTEFYSINPFGECKTIKQR